jgi:hypothetical protein
MEQHQETPENLALLSSLKLDINPVSCWMVQRINFLVPLRPNGLK